MPLISVVVPCFNEAPGLDAFHGRLAAVMSTVPDWEVIYVNDGSADATLDVMRRLRDSDAHVGLMNLSRNFGKEAAMTAGIDAATGDAVVVIDADLQDPPELIPDLIDAWRSGFDVVYAQRRIRHGETWLKRASADLFYRVMERAGRVRLPRDAGDFRLMSRRVVEAVGQLRERHRFMKGLFAWVGFPTRAILYDRAPRHAGSTKWSYWSLWNLALEGITSFTIAPLTIATYGGIVIAVGAILYGLYIFVRTLLFGNPVPGYPSLLVIMLLLGGVQLITLGVIGEYLGRVFNETKERPLYLVERWQPSRRPSDAASRLLPDGDRAG